MDAECTSLGEPDVFMFDSIEDACANPPQPRYVTTGSGSVLVNGVKVGTVGDYVGMTEDERRERIQWAQREAAKKIARDFLASFEIVGVAFKRALPMLRKLMPLLEEIEREQRAEAARRQRRIAAMRHHARRKGRKK